MESFARISDLVVIITAMAARRKPQKPNMGLGLVCMTTVSQRQVMCLHPKFAVI